jgi:phosphoribosylformylglycinamidine (FGAM) synthase-like amidotransferase family enzyme
VKWGVVAFAESTDDRHTAAVLRQALGHEVVSLRGDEERLEGIDCVVLPGGVDDLRAADEAPPAPAPIFAALAEFARRGGLVLGIGRGFRLLCEAGLLPGRVAPNPSGRFVCRTLYVRVESVANAFVNLGVPGDVWRLPVKSRTGCYVAEAPLLDQLERDGQVLLRYCRSDGSSARTGQASDGDVAYNPFAAARDIAGIVAPGKTIFGLMPQPEHASDPTLLAAAFGENAVPDGLRIFQSIAHWASEMRPRQAAESMR